MVIGVLLAVIVVAVMALLLGGGGEPDPSAATDQADSASDTTSGGEAGTTDTQRDAVLVSVSRNASSDALLVACTERLPAGAKMRLVWGKGVETAQAPVVQSGREESFSYVVREPFRASFSCEREKASAPCSSLSAMRFDFSAPVDAKVAARATLKAASGSRAPEMQDGEGSRENTVSGIRFSAPFEQNAELTIDLPKELKDEAGRPLENAASFPLKVRTGNLPPLVKFPGAFGIVELKEGGVVPVTLRNIEAQLPVANLQLHSTEAHRLSAQRLTDDAQVIAAIRALAQFERLFSYLGLQQSDVTLISSNMLKAQTSNSGDAQNAAIPLMPQTVSQLSWWGVSQNTIARIAPSTGRPRAIPR